MNSSTSASPASSAASDAHPLDDFNEYLRGVVGGLSGEALLRRAVTHRSYAYENGGIPHNERLEFLGDSVLGIVVTDALYRKHEDLPEGQLAKLRAAVVNTRALASVARTIGLGDYVLLGKGELATGGRDKDSILADTTEAVIGCVYLELGMPAADALVHHLLDPLMRESASLGAALDWKTSLQEIAAELGNDVVTYDVEFDGPDHDKLFTASACLGADAIGLGTGRSKKAAEQQAAEAAYQVLSERVAAMAGAADDANLGAVGPDCD